MTLLTDRLLVMGTEIAAEELEALLTMLAGLVDEETWLERPMPIWTDGVTTDTILELIEMLCIVRLALVAELMTTTLLVMDEMDSIEELPPLLSAVRVLDGVLIDIDEAI